MYAYIYVNIPKLQISAFLISSSVILKGRFPLSILSGAMNAGVPKIKLGSSKAINREVL